MEKSGKDIQLLERDNPDPNSCVQIIRGKHHEVKWPPSVHGKWQGFGCQHTTCSCTGGLYAKGLRRGAGWKSQRKAPGTLRDQEEFGLHDTQSASTSVDTSRVPQGL